MSLPFDLRQLRYFVEAAHCGGFSAAAANLGLAQPALSRQMKALEAALGARLFVRNGRGVGLTHAGQMLFDRALPLLQAAERAAAELLALGAAPAGEAIIGVPPTVGRTLTVPLMLSVRERHPDVALRVVEGLSGDLSDRLRKGTLDLAILFTPPSAAGVVVEPVAEEPLWCVGRPDVTPRDRLRLADVEHTPMILPAPRHGLTRLFRDACAAAGGRLVTALEVDSLQAMLEAAHQGHGCTIAPSGAVRRELAQGELSAAPLDPPLSRTIYLATGGQRPMALSTPTLAAIVREQIQRLAGEAGWRLLGRRDRPTPVRPPGCDGA